MVSKEQKGANGDPRKDQVDAETQFRVAELLRARELFIKVFKDESPFVNMGYSHKQTQFALPVVCLLEEEGEVQQPTGRPASTYLYFGPQDETVAQNVTIRALRDQTGFEMSGHRTDAVKNFTDEMSAEEKLLTLIFFSNPVAVFDDATEDVVQLLLFKEDTDVYDLDFLARTLGQDYTRAKKGAKRENILTRAGMRRGAMATYQAAWVDEDTKLEFVVKVDAPEDRSTFGSRYFTFRRLDPVQDEQGRMFPFGRKPNATQAKAVQTLEAKSPSFVAGTFAIEGI